MRTTIKQIAERSGLSIPTVSRILSNKGEAHQETTRQRVLQIANDLGYRPNSSARAMRSGRFNNLALLQSATDFTRSLLPMGLLAGIQAAVSDLRMGLSVAALPDTHLTDTSYVPKILQEWAVDGLLINYNAEIPAALIDLIGEFAIPAIWINSLHTSDCVYPDDEGASYTATNHLIELGHRRITYVDFQCSAHYSAAQRRNGYERAMREADLPTHFILDFIFASAYTNLAADVTRRFADGWPTALLTYGPESLRPILLAAAAEKIAIPHDLSVISFTTGATEVIGVPTDTMVLPEEKIGRTAVEMLMAKIADPLKNLPPQPVVFAKEVGWTTAAPPS